MSGMGLIGICDSESPVFNPSQLVPTCVTNLAAGIPRLQRVVAALLENRQGLLIHILNGAAGHALVLERLQIDGICRAAIGRRHIACCHLSVKIPLEGVVAENEIEQNTE